MTGDRLRAGGEGAVQAAFVAAVVIGGSNAVAVRFSNVELAPFWGATFRFGAAAVVLWLLMRLARVPVPRGRALTGSMLYGLLSIGASYALLYWGLLRISAGLTMVVLALVPLLTLLFAVLHRIEVFRPRALAGALVALSGILVSTGGALGASIHWPSLLALLVGAACIAEGSVVYKLSPPTHPVAVNAVSVTTGAIFLLLASLVAGEPHGLPHERTTWVAVLYLVSLGTVVLFYLYLYVLARWTASATAYSFLLFPVATVIIAALVAAEPVTPYLLAGGALVLAGVWLGAVGGARERRARADPAPAGPAPEA